MCVHLDVPDWAAPMGEALHTIYTPRDAMPQGFSDAGRCGTRG